MSWVAVGATAVSVVSGFVGAKKAGKAAKKQAKEEARIEGLLTTERVRQIDKEERSLEGETRAGYAAGGVLSAFGSAKEQPQPLIGSAKTVIDEQATEFGFERQITQETGASNVQQSLARGKSIASQYKFNAISSGASSIASMVNAYKIRKG